MRKRGRKVSIKLEDGLFNVAGLDGKECANVVPPSSRCKGPRVGTPWGELPLEQEAFGNCIYSYRLHPLSFESCVYWRYKKKNQIKAVIILRLSVGMCPVGCGLAHVVELAGTMSTCF